ncbi:MAG: hypothetical protein KDD40_02160 [Bdellovibrionales bacterium]|nr:hypothetical protein [Bdellovibrionales bacterium]
MRFLVALFLAVIGVSSIGQAELYEKDQMFIYKISPYTEVLSEEEIVQFTATLSHAALVSVMESMVTKQVFPESVATIEDVERLRRANKDVDSLVLYLNRLIEEQRAQKGRFSLPDLVPDAFMVFGGKKLSINVGAGVGGSLSLGVILMPVYIEKYSQKTGKLEDEYFSVRFAIVGWGNGDVGAGLGGGSSFRIGLSAIWDLNDAFLSPDQFWGAGLGASWSPLVLGMGVNAKVGFLSNWDMPGWLDFAYISAGLEVGAKVEVSSPRLNFSTFISGARIMSMLESSQKKALEAAMREMSKKFDLIFIEINKQREEIQKIKADTSDQKEEPRALLNP